MTTRLLTLALFACFFACKPNAPESKVPITTEIPTTPTNDTTSKIAVVETPKIDTTTAVTPPPIAKNPKTEEKKPETPKSEPNKPKEKKPTKLISSKDFTDIESLDKSIKLDIRYATTDNFTKAQIYDCAKCYLRPEAAEAIAKAHKDLQKQGLGLKMFDCYRPRPYQQRLWDKVPNPDYVTPPAKGSMHGRGAAVDLTIVDKNGKELDMGTPYDFFGEKAHYDYTNLPEKVLQNRKLLRNTLEKYGFKGIRTEWWHLSYVLKEYPLSVELWDCK
jgi:zinc D-Ala-D-Ala dipeptidase